MLTAGTIIWELCIPRFTAKHRCCDWMNEQTIWTILPAKLTDGNWISTLNDEIHLYSTPADLSACVNYFHVTCKFQLPQALVWSSHIDSAIEWSRGRCEWVTNNSDTHNYTVQLLCARWLAPSLPCARSQWSSAPWKQGLLTLWGQRPRLTPALLWLVIFQPPHVGAFSFICWKVLLDRGHWFLEWCLHAAPALSLCFLNNTVNIKKPIYLVGV